MEELRLINLHDCDTDLLVETNAPAEEIRNAIAHKNKMLEEDDESFRSDFEEMQEYLQNKGYEFDQIGYVNAVEWYLW